MNALVLRDHSITGTDVMSMICADCLEIQSLGQLPNPTAVESTQAGMRYARKMSWAITAM